MIYYAARTGQRVLGSRKSEDGSSEYNAIRRGTAFRAEFCQVPLDRSFRIRHTVMHMIVRECFRVQCTRGGDGYQTQRAYEQLAHHGILCWKADSAMRLDRLQGSTIDLPTYGT